MQINPNTLIQNTLGAADATAKSTGTGTSFSDLLSTVLGDAAEADIADKADTIALLSGEDVELHTSMLTATKAELTLSLAIQIRNKVVDAYTEIMRMQV